MNNDLFYAAHYAVDSESVNRSPSGSVSGGHHPIPGDKHAISFARQISKRGKLAGTYAIFRIRHIVPDYDSIHPCLQQ